MLCGLGLFLLSQNHSFAYTATFSDKFDFYAQDVIGIEEEASKDEKFKVKANGCAFLKNYHSGNKEKNFHPFVSVFLKQIHSLHFSLRSPPIFSL
jgi:hypothetical protein